MCTTNESHVFNITFNVFKELVKQKNLQFHKKLDAQEISLASKEFLSVLVSECLVEDIETIKILIDAQCAPRYIDFIVRNMSEQVIEYLYTMKDLNRVKVYLGENLNINMDDSINPLEGLKAFGQKRFQSGRNVCQMAEEINESESTDDKLSLYDIFKIYSELAHNSYFNTILDSVGKFEGENHQYDENLFIYLGFIISAFSNEYMNF